MPRRSTKKGVKPAKTVDKSPLNRAALRVFRELLLRHKKALVGNVNRLGDDALKKNRQDASGDLSAVPLHMADQGSDEIEQAVTLGLMESEQDELTEIEEALARIKESVFGLCELCHKAIPQQRLKAIPYARFCLLCKQKEEKAE